MHNQLLLDTSINETSDLNSSECECKLLLYVSVRKINVLLHFYHYLFSMYALKKLMYKLL